MAAPHQSLPAVPSTQQQAFTRPRSPPPSALVLLRQAQHWAVIYLFTRLTHPLDYEFLKGRDLSYPFIFISLVPSTE